MNLLDNKATQPSKFRTKNWVEINDDRWGTYSTNNQIRFKITILKSSLGNYSHAYILVKETITVAHTSGKDTSANNTNKKVIF